MAVFKPQNSGAEAEIEDAAHGQNLCAIFRAYSITFFNGLKTNQRRNCTV